MTILQYVPWAGECIRLCPWVSKAYLITYDCVQGSLDCVHMPYAEIGPFPP